MDPPSLLQRALQYYFGLKPLGVFEVADTIYGLNFKTVAATLKAPEVVKVRQCLDSYFPHTPQHTPKGQGTHSIIRSVTCPVQWCRCPAAHWLHCTRV